MSTQFPAVIERHRLWAQAPLRLVIIVPFTAIIIITVTLTSYLSYRNSQKTVDTMVAQLLNETNARIAGHLDSFLAIPQFINQMNANAIQSGLIEPDDVAKLQHYFWEQIQHYETVTSIYFGNREGGLVLSGREGADGSLYIIYTDNFVNGPFNKYAVDDAGNATDLIVIVPDFDSRTRPWYVAAKETQGESWTSPYVLFTGQDLAIAASQPVYAPNGDLLGVMSIDIFASHINDFLEGLEIGKTGQVYIVDESEMLVATSTTAPTFTSDDGENWRRLSALESDRRAIHTSAEFINVHGGFEGINQQQQFSFLMDGKPHYLLVSPFQTIPGINWHIVTSISEDDYLGKIKAHNQTTLTVTILAVGGAVLFGIIAAYQVIKPVTTLNVAAKALAAGDWTQRVPIHGVQEVRELGHSFNMMAQELRKDFNTLEERVRARTIELEEAKHEAEHANKTKSDFLSNVSHDLRTPLTIIETSIYLLERSNEPEAQQAKIKTIKQQSQRLRGLVDDLLLMGRLEREPELHFAPVEINQMLREISASLATTAQKKQQTITLKTDGTLIVPADEKRLYRVFINLLENAINYTPENGKIYITTSLQKMAVVIEIADNGIGIPSIDQPYIFDTFYRADKARSANTGGSGLGLAIVKKIIEGHGGRIEFESPTNEGKGGTVFRIFLPTGSDNVLKVLGMAK